MQLVADSKRLWAVVAHRGNLRVFLRFFHSNRQRALWIVFPLGSTVSLGLLAPESVLRMSFPMTTLVWPARSGLDHSFSRRDRMPVIAISTAYRGRYLFLPGKGSPACIIFSVVLLLGWRVNLVVWAAHHGYLTGKCFG